MPPAPSPMNAKNSGAGGPHPPKINQSKKQVIAEVIKPAPTRTNTPKAGSLREARNDMGVITSDPISQIINTSSSHRSHLW